MLKRLFLILFLALFSYPLLSEDFKENIEYTCKLPLNLKASSLVLTRNNNHLDAKMYFSINSKSYYHHMIFTKKDNVYLSPQKFGFKLQIDTTENNKTLDLLFPFGFTFSLLDNLDCLEPTKTPAKK
ncbi:MAG: hypothetical protein LBH40_03615 [Alphaproteobacteria bacterium]|jgi:hypothetical protein|nr:hypothetical protein [Alphaproteobacteria bacterium]